VGRPARHRCTRARPRNQFLLYGNVNDHFVLPLSEGPCLGSIYDFLRRGDDAGLSTSCSATDLGNGHSRRRGRNILQKNGPGLKENHRSCRRRAAPISTSGLRATSVTRQHRPPRTAGRRQSVHHEVRRSRRSGHGRLSETTSFPALALLMRGVGLRTLSPSTPSSLVLIADYRAPTSHPPAGQQARARPAIESAACRPWAKLARCGHRVIRRGHPIALKELRRAEASSSHSNWAGATDDLHRSPAAHPPSTTRRRSRRTTFRS